MRKIAVSSKVAEQDPVELLRRGQVSAERLFDDDAGALGAARLGELFHDQPEQRGWDGEVVRRPLGGAEFLADGLKGCRVVVVAVDVAQQAAELVEGRGIEAAVFLDAVACPRPELVEVPAGLGHADDRHVRGGRASPSPAAPGRSSCKPDRPWHRRRPGRRSGIRSSCSLLLAVTWRRISPGVRRTGSAWPRAACPGNPPRRARRSARRAPW